MINGRKVVMWYIFRTADMLECPANCPEIEGTPPYIMRPMLHQTSSDAKPQDPPASPIIPNYRKYEYTGLKNNDVTPVYQEVR